MFIYIITSHGFCKIGYAKDVDGRMSDSQCFCPPCVRLVLHRKFKVSPGKVPKLIEKWCHFELKKYWTTKGEWFKVDPRVAARVIVKVMRRKLTSEPEWFVRKEQSKIHWSTHGAVMSKAVKKKWEDPAYRSMMLKVLKSNRIKTQKKWKDINASRRSRIQAQTRLSASR